MSIVARITSSVTLLYLETSSCRAFCPSPVVPVLFSCLGTSQVEMLVFKLVEKAWHKDLDLPFSEAATSCASAGEDPVPAVLRSVKDAL